MWLHKLVISKHIDQPSECIFNFVNGARVLVHLVCSIVNVYDERTAIRSFTELNSCSSIRDRNHGIAEKEIIDFRPRAR